MSDGLFDNDTVLQAELNRREFIRWNALLAGALAAGGCAQTLTGPKEDDRSQAASRGPARIVRVGCPSHNCGGKCLLKVHVRDGVIVRIEGDDRPTDEAADPQLRACARGRAYRRRQYHPERLKYPMKRVGKRGEGKFKRISWDAALATMATEMQRIKQRYGNAAQFVPYGTGSYSNTNGSHVARRLMNCFGGCLGIYNSYSWACINIATPSVYGTSQVGSQRQDWLNSKYILMWGWNPAEMRDGTNSDYFVSLARKRGARVVCIDPRMSMSAVSLADQWIPIRPGTDTAMMSAMAYVMISESLVDQAFVDTYCVGFDAAHMPAGAEGAESYKDYILGTRDGIPKTPQWAQAITAVPSQTIVQVARDYATIRPGMLYQGYGMQRRAYGEQVVRAGAVLTALTGNIGISGGWASGLATQAPDGGPFWTAFPSGRNPVKTRIPCFLWTEAVLNGRSMTAAEHGIRNAERLDSDIKLIYAVASNALINQHANVNRAARILADESRVEFIAVQDNFLTPTGRFADILLPACTQFETYGIEDGWKYGDEVLLMPKVVDPPYECKSDYQICAELAERLGIKDAFTEGRSERDWVEWILQRYRDSRFPGIPELDEFERSNRGVFSRRVDEPAIGLADFRRDPVKHPLPTPSGKIEIFSKQLFDMNNPQEIPAVPKYIQEWESPFGPEAEQYPLQAMGHHAAQRVHSTHDNVDWLNEAFAHCVFMNPRDAASRSIQEGDEVRVYNDRGSIILPCQLTPRILPGVVDVPQGAWWEPDENGVDRRGNINVLTSERWTAWAKGNAQHTIMVQVQKA
jgi:anaerobic dimethyl sulfoxide reductase subunit A